MTVRLPDGFVLGVSTAAYQIEGGWDADGKGESIWDRYAHTPGTIDDGDTGDVAADHYHRWAEDLDLIAGAGLNAYRFSCAWTRVMPEGTGRVNEAGLAFYDRIVDGCLERGVEPWMCFHHWDLPQVLEDRGGWTSRDVVGWFGDYAEVMARRFGDRVSRWAPLNEPNTLAVVGYGGTEHAPGRRDRHAACMAIHHANLATVQAAQAIRASRSDASIGAVVLQNTFPPASDSAADRSAAEAAETWWNRGVTDPLVRGVYGPELSALDPVYDECDADRIAQLPGAIDWLGVNYYGPSTMAANDKGRPRWTPPADAERTDMGWEVDPAGLTGRLLGLRRAGWRKPMYVTESGAAYPDVRGVEGGYADAERTRYLHDHLAATLAAREQGVDVRGYFAWSLTDNFEWARGYAKRFGLVHIDYSTQTRTPKASYGWMREVARTRALVPADPR